MARDINTAWQQLSDTQQAGLDAALAAKTKSRKNKAVKAASDSSAPNTDAAANGTHPGPGDASGVTEGSTGLPNQGTASGAGQEAGTGPGVGTSAEGNGHLASEENQAANRQLPAPGTSSISKSQVSAPNLTVMLGQQPTRKQTVWSLHFDSFLTGAMAQLMAF